MATNNAASAKYMGGMDQSRMRGHAVWFDQHRNPHYRNAKGETPFTNGRPYYSVIELSTRMPCGPVMPLEWSAPFLPPQQYLVRSIGRITNLPNEAGEGLDTLRQHSVTDRFRVDYQAMLRDDTEAAQAHWRLAVAEAARRDWEVPRWGQLMDHRLLAIVGPAPRSPKIAEALIAGNPWILGQQEATWNAERGQMEVEEDEQLARLLVMNRTDLVTPEQAERMEQEREARAAAQPQYLAPDLRDELMELLREANERQKEAAAKQEAMQKEIDALKSTPKRGRPPKKPAPASAA